MAGAAIVMGRERSSTGSAARCGAKRLKDSTIGQRPMVWSVDLQRRGADRGALGQGRSSPPLCARALQGMHDAVLADVDFEPILAQRCGADHGAFGAPALVRT